MRYRNGNVEVGLPLNQHEFQCSEATPVFKAAHVNPLRNLDNILYPDERVFVNVSKGI